MAKARTDYDGAFRLIFSYVRVLSDLLTGFVNEPPLEKLDLSTLQEVSARSVSDVFARREGDAQAKPRQGKDRARKPGRFLQRENDAIWKARTKTGDDAYIYLMVEYQSRSAWDMAVRVCFYIMLFYVRLAREPEVIKRGKLPQVLAIVLYNGKARWNAKTSLQELIDVTLPELIPYGMAGSYIVIDIRHARKLKRELRNVADVVFRLQRLDASEVAKQEIDYLNEWLPGKQWAGLRRVIANWMTNVLLPEELEEFPGREVQDLWEVREMFDEQVLTWGEKIKAKSRAEGRTEGQLSLLVEIAKLRFGETVATAMAALLGHSPPESKLQSVTEWVALSSSGDTLLAKLREI